MTAGDAVPRLGGIERLVLAAAVVLAAFLLVPTAVVVPFGGLVIGPVLALGGAFMRRRASHPVARAAGLAAIVLGGAILALGLLLVFAYSTGGGTNFGSGFSSQGGPSPLA